MPLVDMGLVGRAHPNGAALSGVFRGHAAVESERVVRCIAGFYEENGNVDVVAQALRARFGLGDDRVTVIRPQGLERHTFDCLARRWQRLRPTGGLLRQLARLGVGAATGLVTGGFAASLGWAWTQTGSVWADPLGWLVPGMWAGALAGAVTAGVVARRQARHRFDDTVARKLRRGYIAVVAHGLNEADEAPVLAYLQDTSHSWCAEAPQSNRQL